MSYILDALRKADAERERDPSRGIHAQPAVAAPTRAGAQVPRWTWAAAAAVVVVSVGYLAWPDAPADVVSAPAPLAPQPVQAVPAPEPTPLVTVASSVQPPAPPPLPAPVERAAPTRVAVQRAAASAPAAAPPAATPAAVAPPVVAAVAPAASAAGAGRIHAVAELPADVQRELPKLAISGGVHSENASQRLLVVGGQVVNEGAELAPGVVLEQIRARNAVLRFRGFRYSVPF
jgi:general secretion pathway protein B